jgi:hypothetical protein
VAAGAATTSERPRGNGGTAVLVAVSLWVLMLVLVAAGVAMKAAGWKGDGGTGTASNVALTLAFVSFATMGAVVAARVPQNPLGWLFLAIGLLAALSVLSEYYAFRGLVERPGSLSLALPVAWVYAWLWYPTVILLLFVPLLYPSGRVPGPRWRLLLTAEIVFALVVTALYMLDPGRLDDDKRLPLNPVGVGPLGTAVDHLGPVLGVSAFTFIVLGIASLVIRFRRSRDIERQQIKIRAFAAVCVLAGIGLSSVTTSAWGDVVTAATILLFPVAVGVAMLRYRLYDVDRVINKTLVYGALTTVLAGAYAGLVLASQALFSSFSHGSNVGIAISTLLVAALFMPLRQRIQGFVDRRFYRGRHDAARTLDRFTARLRREIDIDTVQGDLLAVVRDTLQPAETWLWLRDP